MDQEGNRHRAPRHRRVDVAKEDGHPGEPDPRVPDGREADERQGHGSRHAKGAPLTAHQVPGDGQARGHLGQQQEAPGARAAQGQDQGAGKQDVDVPTPDVQHGKRHRQRERQPAPARRPAPQEAGDDEQERRPPEDERVGRKGRQGAQHLQEERGVEVGALAPHHRVVIRGRRAERLPVRERVVAQADLGRAGQVPADHERGSRHPHGHEPDDDVAALPRRVDPETHLGAPLSAGDPQVPSTIRHRPVPVVTTAGG